MSSIRASIFRTISSAYVRRVNVEKVDLNKIRKLWGTFGRFMFTASGVVVAKDQICGLHAEWLTPDNAAPGKLLLYLHGGGYVVGGCDMHRQLVSHIARAGRIKALLPEYRLSPEAKYPAAIDDAVAVYKAVLASGIKPQDIIIAGDSAGGGLTMATLLTLRDAGEPLPAAAVLLSPFLDLTGSGESMRTRASNDPWFSAEDLPLIANLYCEPEQQGEPRVSPVFADVANLPPIYIQVGNEEILLSDSERLRDNIIAAGGTVQLDIWPDMWHVFQMFIGKMPEARRAVDKIGSYLQSGVRPQF